MCNCSLHSCIYNVFFIILYCTFLIKKLYLYRLIEKLPNSRVYFDGLNSFSTLDFKGKV